MEKLVINGGKRLAGRVKISGAKNAVLPIIAATLLGQDTKSRLDEVPALEDVHTIAEVLRELGVNADYDAEAHQFTVESSNIVCWEAPYDLVRKMRASFLIMGPLLARCGRAKISLPGGCAIGTRPIDLHLKGFEALGAEIEIGHGFIDANAPQGLKGARIYLDFPSVGATENVMLAACAAEGTTVLTNAAREPEIVDLQSFLNAKGASIHGAGSPEIRIDGFSPVPYTEHSVLPDRIAAATYLCAAAAAGGDIRLTHAVPEHLETVLSALRQMGCAIVVDADGIRLRRFGPMRAGRPVITRPYPGFPTDAQALLMAASLRAEGTNVFVENIFESRFRHVPELRRFGADVRVEGRVAMVCGVKTLYGAPVTATDLRGGAAMVLAGLSAEGETQVFDSGHIERGYERFDECLGALGADVKRLEDPQG